MMIPIPTQDTKKFTQLNSSDILGSLFATKNMDFDRPGYAKLARRVKYVKQAATNASSPNNLGIVFAVVYDVVQSCYVAITNGGIYNSTSNTNITTWTKDTGSNAPGDSTDGVFWNGALYVIAQTTYVAKKLSGTWSRISTSGVAPTTSSVVHPAIINVKANTLCYGDANIVRQINSDDSAGTDLTLPTNYVITSMAYENDRIYIGTYDKNGANAKVFVWDGISDEALASYDAKSQYVASMCGYLGSVAIVNGRGQVLAFNGGDFKQIAALPVFYEKENWYTGFSIHSVPVLPKGMKSVGEKILINIGTSVVTSTGYKKGIPYMPAGVWCYDSNVGLYHKYAPSVYQTTTDFGQAQVSQQAGTIAFLMEAPVVAGNLPSLADGSEIFFGGQVIKESNSSGNTYNCLCSPTSGVNRGYLITAKIPSLGVTDLVQKLYIKWKMLKQTTDKILVYSRNEERYALPFVSDSLSNVAITWTSSTVFTTTGANFAYVEAGDLVEILSGVGAGYIAKISSILESGGTYTVTLAAAIGGANTNTGNVLVSNFTLVKTIDYTKTKGFMEIPIGKTAKWSQYMLEFQGEEIELEEIQVINKARKPSK